MNVTHCNREMARRGALRPRRARASSRHGMVMTLALVGLGLVAGAVPARAATPGQVLRDYLEARLRGDVTAAQALWARAEVRRARAMGTRYAPVEARFDDYILLSAGERAAAAEAYRVALTDSVVEDDVAHFHVAVIDRASGKQTDTLHYLVQRQPEGWRVSLPLMHDTRAWTRRDGRFVRLRAKRLVLVNKEAMQTLDDEVLRILDALGTPERGRLRLERVKLEIFLCENDADVEALLGSAGRAGYLRGTERIVTTQLVDTAALTRALVNLTLRNTPPAGPPMLEDGLACALGGTPGVAGPVILARARAVLRRGERSPLDLLDAPDLDADTAELLRAGWAYGLLRDLGPEAFFAMYRGLCGTPGAMRAQTDAATVAALEKATGANRQALAQRVRQAMAAYEPNLRAGCDFWPANRFGLQAMLQWRDPDERWGLRGYEVDDDYLLTVAPYERGMPAWVKKMTDSLAAAQGTEPVEFDVATGDVQPQGDPPDIALLVQKRLNDNPEPYESALFLQHFAAREYAEDLYGLFISVDDVRLFDYRRDALVAEFSRADAVEGDLPYYDPEKGRLCFRFARNLIARPLTYYYVRSFVYTGE